MLASAEVHLFPNGVPNYFSGTNCRVFADAVATGAPTQGFTHVWIDINSETVAEFQTDLGVVAMQHASAAAMFDSTHFAPGTTVSVTAYALDEDGVLWQSSNYSIPVKNKMHLFGRYDLEVEPLAYWWYEDGSVPAGYYSSPPGGTQNQWAGATPIRDLYGQSSKSFYDFFLVTAKGWTMLSYLSTLESIGANVAYVNTHGGLMLDNAYFESDRGDWWFDYPAVPPIQNENLQQAIFGTFPIATDKFDSVYPYRFLSNGSGLPPFNDGEPPINLAFVDGCESAHPSQTFDLGYLYPYTNAFVNGPTENQAFVGWETPIAIDQTWLAVQTIFKMLEEGYSVKHVDGVLSEIEVLPNFVVFGDKFTRISGCYDPSVEPATHWKRGL